MKHLRLLLWNDCNRKCEYCCNKQHTFKQLTLKAINLRQYENISISGGEPTLYPDVYYKIAKHIHCNTGVLSKQYLYTAGSKQFNTWLKDNTDEWFAITDGITYTIHTPEDITLFEEFDRLTRQRNPLHFSRRLKIMCDVELPECCVQWDIKYAVPLEDCPTPKDEETILLIKGE